MSQFPTIIGRHRRNINQKLWPTKRHDTTLTKTDRRNRKTYIGIQSYSLRPFFSSCRRKSRIILSLLISADINHGTPFHLISCAALARYSLYTSSLDDTTTRDWARDYGSASFLWNSLDFRSVFSDVLLRVQSQAKVSSFVLYLWLSLRNSVLCGEDTEYRVLWSNSSNTDDYIFGHINLASFGSKISLFRHHQNTPATYFQRFFIFEVE